MAECRRGTGPWQSHPKRMLRHKAMIQCARLAFGYGGIYDQDEAERIVEAQPIGQQRQPVDMGQAEVVQPDWPADRWAAGLAKWVDGIAAGKPLADVLAWLNSKAKVTPEQEQQLRVEVEKRSQPVQTESPDLPEVDPEKLIAEINAATTLDAVYERGGLIDAIADPAEHHRVTEIFEARVAELEQS